MTRQDLIRKLGALTEEEFARVAPFLEADLEAVDDLAASLMALTVFDHRSAEPLPLWYARESLSPIRKRFQGKNWLDVYKSMVKKAMRGEQVETAWLRGWEQQD